MRIVFRIAQASIHDNQRTVIYAFNADRPANNGMTIADCLELDSIVAPSGASRYFSEYAKVSRDYLDSITPVLPVALHPAIVAKMTQAVEQLESIDRSGLPLYAWWMTNLDVATY